MPRAYLQRQYKRRFLRPILRYRLNGSVLAWTCFWGVGWGVTPSVGLQTVFVLITWFVSDRIMGHRFNWPIALVLTLITNPFTMLPIYFFYFGLGCYAVDCTLSADLLFAALRQGEFWSAVAAASGTILESYLLMWLGSVPFVIAGALGGYFFGLLLGNKLEARRNERALRRRARTRAAHGKSGGSLGGVPGE